MSKKINFRPARPELDIKPVEPASKFIPEWFKNTPIAKEGQLTAKRCVPILDALTAGYIVQTSVDITFSVGEDGKPKHSDNAVFKAVSEHLMSQTDSFEISDAYDPQPFKFNNLWHIETPKGYSTLFVHPLNRTDLPFYSFNGLVDTDKHPLITNFPFFIKKGFEGTIPAGTPIIQAIPIKRESWSSSIKDEHKPYSYPKEYEVNNAPFAWYKRNVWFKKKYQ